ncbi:hypothetical protein Thexy_0757 [Thermoanaerobacterium xylanolyticum LX-11]|uniref:Uncharacterized protein n=1 Tax=Thermoanaerobacterium xylanolyticum (strain ATCC 49914 / DSM 7097 / LX-11) TaxID=858215 RepID=F6BIQ6_THEXL|nr:hypothetical protein [Thermoanaerobacterium xylanolyticum]AEF16800.1 hypothetical protein Thexy_0757 [Thermoanaerobacterium xylanolyticum LX-11]
MNLKELKERLIKENIPQIWWGIPGQFSPASLSWLEQNEEGNWIVYDQDERGNKYTIKTFTSEEEACEFFYNYVIKEYEEAKPYIGKGKDL